MFFTECARLAELHPDLASTVQQLDKVLAGIPGSGVIRVDDLASFLRTDPNQIHALLEKLTQKNLLLAEEIVECGHCRMAALHSDYQEQLSGAGYYRCSSCGRQVTDKIVKVLTTYRPGDKWQGPLKPMDDSMATRTTETSSPGIPSNLMLDDQAWYTHDRLAKIFNVGKDALRKRLDRHRQQDWNGWKENEDRRPREPKYLYRFKDVKHIVEELQASSQRPAK